MGCGYRNLELLDDTLAREVKVDKAVVLPAIDRTESITTDLKPKVVRGEH